MDKKELGTKIAQMAADRVGLSRDGLRCTVMRGNNGTEKTCILRVDDKTMGIRALPSFDIDWMLKDISLNKMTVEDAASHIAGWLYVSEGLLKGIDRDYVLKNCRTKVVSARMNIEELAERPYRLFCDLAELVIVPTPVDDRGGRGFFTVDNMLIEALGISAEELFERARKRTRDHMTLIPMRDFIDDSKDSKGVLHILTNDETLYGAAALGCPESIEDCIKRLGGEFFIIPSSVHEVLLCRKEKGLDAMGIAEIIRGVNKTCVDDDEVLSDRLYEVEGGKLCIVA